MGRATTVGAVAALTLAAALAGCTGGSGGAAPTPSPSTSSTGAPPAPQTLRFSVYGGPSAMRAYRAIADTFEAEHPGVTIRLKQHSDAASAAEDALADLSTPDPAASTSGSAPPSSSATPRALTPPDVFLLDQRYLPDLVATGRLHPLDGGLEERGVEFGDDYQRIALTAFSADSALQCMPFEMSPTVLFVNTRIVRFGRPPFEEVEPPADDGAWRWEDFAATARLVAADPARAGVKAAYLPPDAELLAALIRTAGGDIVDDTDRPTTLTLDSDAAREALTAYVELAQDRSVSLTVGQALRVSPLKRFAEGRLAFLFGTRADVPELRASGVRFDALSVPGFGRPRTTSTISALCVDAQSEVRETAVDFVAHAVSKESQGRAALSGAIVPASLEVVNSPEFEQRGRMPRTIAPFIEGQKRSVLIPYSLGWPVAETRIEELIARLVGGTARDLPTELDEALPAIDERSPTWFEDADPSE